MQQTTVGDAVFGVAIDISALLGVAVNVRDIGPLASLFGRDPVPLYTTKQDGMARRA